MLASAPAVAVAEGMPAAAAVPALLLSEEAFGDFYARTARPLWAYLAAAGGSPTLADDLAQEAFLRLLRADFRPQSEEHLRAYLFRIAANLLRDHYRAARRTGEAPAGEPAVAAATAEVDRRRDLDRFLARLRPRDRQLLWLAHVEGKSHREVAGELGLREGSVRLLLFRARRRLAALLRAGGYARPETEEES